MSDYSKTTNFTAKDALSSGDPDKLIKGSLFDTEFDALAVASATKYDSGDLASQAQAEAGTSNTVLITPLRAEQHVAAYVAENGGMLLDIHALADPGNDTLLGWDDSAGAVIGFTFTDGLAFGDGVVTMEHLGIQDLEDAGADRILFWDDGEGATGWLQATNGVEISGTTLVLSDISKGAGQPINISSGTLTWDDSSLDAFVAGDWAAVSDGIYVSDAGTLKLMSYLAMGLQVGLAETTQTLALLDTNKIHEFNGTATITLPVDATHTWERGSAMIICVDHATQQVAVTADTSVVLNSVFHPGGGSAATDHVVAGGTAVLLYLGSDEWYLSGDIVT